MDYALGRRATRSWLGRLTLSILATSALFLAFTQTGSAATGDKIRQITAADPQGCIPGVNRGLAFDGTNLLVSCDNQSIIDVISPADGSLVRTQSITGLNGTQASAWDATRNKLWVCSGYNGVYLADMGTGVATFQFITQGCPDGLAYDGSDDTIWASCDECDDLYHYTSSGSEIGHFTGMAALLGGHGNSGIAVGGPDLFLSNDGGAQVWRAPKTVDSASLFFDNVDDAGEPRRIEDMECDNITFAGQGKQAMWVQDAYDRVLKAVEIEPNLCGFGGLAPATPKPAAATAPAQAVVQQAKPVAKASLRSGQKGCTRTSASARVSGENISTVTYSLDGKKIKTAKGNKSSVTVSARHLKSGTHSITARITYTAATAAKSQTKRISFTRCARKAAKPKFTG